MIFDFNKLCFFGALWSTTAFAFPNCPLLGPDFPAPKSLSSSNTFQRALNNLTQLLSQTIESGNTTYGLFDSFNNSFSIEIFSVDETLFSNQYTAPALATVQFGVHNVTPETVFRIGSLTKLVTVYTFLINAGGDTKWNDPVTKYLPELQQTAEAVNASHDSIDYVSWEDVTLWELASQMSGLGRDFSGAQELDSGGLFPVSDPSTLGLPPLNASEVPLCTGGPYCTRAQFFEGFTKRHPVYAPSTNPIYSNAAFTILGYVIEGITGSNMSTLVWDSIINPLNMTHSSWDTPESNSSAILPDGNLWALDLGDETPAGGMYSCSSDLTKFGRSILTSSLISPAQTRRWMQPRGFTSRSQAAVGAPWEIFSTKIFPGERSVYLYTKEGDITGYSSLLVLAKDWDLGFNILTAGPGSSPSVILLGSLIADTILQAVEDVAREEAETTFAATYKAADQTFNSSIKISLDASKPGLGISSWISNGTDMLRAAAVQAAEVAAPSVRLYPTGLERDLGNGDKDMIFRAVAEDLNAPVVGGLFGSACETWVGVDAVMWGGISTDEFLITVGEDGVAKSVTPRALRVALVRTEDKES